MVCDGTDRRASKVAQSSWHITTKYPLPRRQSHHQSNYSCPIPPIMKSPQEPLLGEHKESIDFVHTENPSSCATKWPFSAKAACLMPRLASSIHGTGSRLSLLQAAVLFLRVRQAGSDQADTVFRPIASERRNTLKVWSRCSQQLASTRHPYEAKLVPAWKLSRSLVPRQEPVAYLPHTVTLKRANQSIRANPYSFLAVYPSRALCELLFLTFPLSLFHLHGALLTTRIRLLSHHYPFFSALYQIVCVSVSQAHAQGRILCTPFPALALMMPASTRAARIGTVQSTPYPSLHPLLESHHLLRGVLQLSAPSSI